MPRGVEHRYPRPHEIPEGGFDDQPGGENEQGGIELFGFGLGFDVEIEIVKGMHWGFLGWTLALLGGAWLRRRRARN